MASETRAQIPNPYKEVNYNVRIGTLTTSEKMDLLANLFLKLEHKHLREPHRVPQAKPEAKIASAAPVAHLSRLIFSIA